MKNKPEDIEDIQLIRSFRNGNTVAFNTLFIRWHDKIYRFAFRFFADPDEAMEITQKTFIKVYHKMDTLDDDRKFSSWIYRIANNLCLDELKRAGRRRSVSLDEWTEPKITLETDTPQEELEEFELKELLQRALLAIPKEQRTVIILKEFEELTFREISEILDEPENTVKSRMYYGLSALRKIFKKWNIKKGILNYE
ncbi:MAG: RNA polymerase sigma factor [Balneolaceae bacterium]